MNTKNIWTTETFGLLAIAGFLALAAFWLNGYRVNLTSSLPEGVYQFTDEPTQAGDLVTFCLDPENPFFSLAKKRGYLGPGACPSGLRPLLKHLAGLPGDRLEITADGLTLNGCFLPGTARPTLDHQGRELPPSLLRAGRIPDGFGLVLSQEHSGSFDSRHFGLVPLVSLRKVRPVLIFYNKKDTRCQERINYHAEK